MAPAESDEGEGHQGRVRASWASGHEMASGLPEILPEWLYALRGQHVDTPRVVRRGRPWGAPARVDWAATLKRWSTRGHSDAALVWERAPRGAAPLVVLWDVSGSMAGYVDWYFAWLYRLMSQRADTHVFAFGTTLADLTAAMGKPYAQAVRDLYASVPVWGSGTAIGPALRSLDGEAGRGLLGPGSQVMIISDGWDVGSPDELEAMLRSLAERTRRVWWVNPLMITPGFEPRTRALKIAAQYVWHMTSGATEEDLRWISWMVGLSA